MNFFNFFNKQGLFVLFITIVSLLGSSSQVFGQCTCTVQAGSGFGSPNFSQVFNAATTTFSGTICISGTFTQDVPNFTFSSGASVRMMNTSAEIIVPSTRKLTINGATVQRCSTNVAWNRINVQSGGSLDILNGSTISGSLNGVVLRDNNVFNLTGSSYSGNTNAAVTIGGVQQTSSHIVSGNTFSNGMVGISIGRNTNVGTLAAQNVFVGLNTYTALSSGIAINFGTYVDINGGLMTAVGNGVFLNSSSFTNIQNTNITANSVGINANLNSSKLFIGTNRIRATLECILIQNHTTQNVGNVFPNIELLNNSPLNAGNYGIRLANISGTDAVYITGNRVFNPRIVGIEATNSSARFSILQNRVGNATGTIFIPGGIRLASCTNQNRIVENNIELFEFATMDYGILVSNCAKNQVVANTIRGGENNNAFTMGRGIRMENNNSGNNLLCCNDVDRCTQGVYFAGTNSSCRITGTTFRRHTDGLFLDNAQLGGDQDWQGNDWRTPPAQTSRDARYVGSPFLLNANEFRTSGFLINNSLAKVDPMSGWFIQQNGTDQLCSFSQTSYCGVQPQFLIGTGGEAETIKPTDLWAIQGETYPGYGVVKWENQRGLYEKLLANPTLVSSSGKVSAFYTDAQQGLIGAFQSVDAGLRNLQSPSNANATNFQTLGQSLNDQVAQIKQLNNQILNAVGSNKTALELQRKTLLLNFETNATAYNAIKESTNLEWTTRVTALKTLNDNMQVSEQWQIDERRINGFWLNSLLQESVSFTDAEKQTIDAIAEQCPLIGGRAVFKARELQAYYRVPHWNDQTCLPVDSRDEYKEVNATTIATDFSVFPNPADDVLTISLSQNLTSTAKVSISDLSGRLLSTQSMDAETQQLILPLNKMVNGIYVVILRMSDGKTMHQKFVVNH
jgi:hypothetical protein